MTRKTINKLQDYPNFPSKDEEILYLKECADVPNNTYIKSLFNPELIKRFTTAVNNDLCFDVIGEADYYQNLYNEERARAGTAESRLKEADKQLELKNEALDMYKSELEKANDKIAALKRERDRLQEQTRNKLRQQIKNNTRCPNPRLYNTTI